MTRNLILSLITTFAMLLSGIAGAKGPAIEPLQGGDALPALEAESLSEEVMKLPEGAQGDIAIVIFSFSKEGGEAGGAWLTSIQERFTSIGVSNIWQVMVLEDVPSLFRGFAIGGIKKGIPESMHSQALTLYEDGSNWEKRCAIQSDDIPCVMLLDAGGNIRWIRTSAVTETLLADFGRELQALLQQQTAIHAGGRSSDEDSSSFLATLNMHLRAIQERDLEALLATITANEDLVLIFPDGEKLNTRQEYVDFHRSWFEDSAWEMDTQVLHTIETPELAHALVKYRYESTTEEGDARTSINYVAFTFARESGEWRLVFDQNTRIKVIVEDAR